MWESVAHDRYLSPYDPQSVHQRGTRVPRAEDGVGDETAFSKEVRQYVPSGMTDRWTRAKNRGELV